MIALVRALLRLALPRDERDVVLDDLDEEFARVRSERTVAAAGIWFMRQALGSLPFALALRIRRRTRARNPAPASLAAGLRADVRQAIRVFGRQRGGTLSAVLTLALGIGVCTAVASIAHALLLRPLPYANPGEVVCIFESDAQRPDGRRGLSYPDFLDLQRAAGATISMAGYSGGSRTLTGSGAADRIPVVEVTPGFFSTLGVEPTIGRDFPDVTSAPAVILSYRIWERRFARDPLVVGRLLTLNGQPHEVAGVLPASFEFPLRGLADLFVPLLPSDAQRDRRYWHWLDVIARPDPGAPLARGTAASLAAVLATADPAGHRATDLQILSLRDVVLGRVRTPTLLVVAAAALVLLIACANVAGLFLSRWTGRMHEMQVRAAIGATPFRLVRQLVVENGLVAVMGGVAGSAAAAWIVRLFVKSMPREHAASLPGFDGIGVQPLIAIAAVAVATASGLVFGAIPAVAASRSGSTGRPEGGRAAAPRQRRLQMTLVTIEVALAVMLLTTTSLLGRSVVRLLDLSPGFETRGLLTARVSLPGARYRRARAVMAFRDELLERVRSLPGVIGADTIDQLPLTGTGNTAAPEIHGAAAGTLARPTVGIRSVGIDYFRTMGIPLLAGRSPGPLDADGAPRVAVVNRAFADRLGGEATLRTSLAFESLPGPAWRIVGVVGNEQFSMPGAEMMPVVYFPFAQNAGGAFTVVLRTSGRPETLVRPLTAILTGIDPDVPLFSARTMDEIYASSEAVFVRSRVLWLLAIFAAAAVTLAATGLYATLAQGVACQQRELGVRIAVGASRVRIAGLVLRRGAAPAALGMTVGLLGSLAASRIVRSLLFETSPLEPAAYAAVAAAVVLLSLMASLLPALRATRIDPITCLRSE